MSFEPTSGSEVSGTLLDGDAPWVFYETPHEIQKQRRRIEEFLLPILRTLDASKVLEVGCGSGHGTLRLRELGLDAWGVDPYFREDVSQEYPYLHRGSGMSLAFAAATFDATFALEVIEHIGTTNGGLPMMVDFLEQRERFVAELCRVTRGAVIIATPNKRFPFDEHSGQSGWLRGFRVHSPFEQFTLSLGELEAMFRKHGYQLASLLDPKGYYALERIERRFGRVGVVGSNVLLALSTRRFLARSVLNPHLFLMFEPSGVHG